MASNTIEQALYVRLHSTTASTEVNDALSSNIFFIAAEQGTTRPYCTYFVVSDPHDPFAFDKGQAGDARIQFNVYDNDRYSALDAAHAVRDNLDQYQGSMDGVTVLKLTCGGIITRALPDEDNAYMAGFDALIRYVDP
jgi:hypothetical protein